MFGLFKKKLESGRSLGQKSFEAVFHEHYEYVLRLALNLSGNMADAEDITQEVFIAVNKGLRDFEGRSKLQTWIYRIVIRVSSRYLGRRKLMDSIDERTEHNVRHSQETKSDDSNILKVMLQLPLEQRTLISLSAIEGLSHQQLAEVLNVPVGTIGSRLHTARKNLSELLVDSF